MSEPGADMNRTQRAALLLMTLGEDDAAEVLKYMDAQEVQALGAAMASLKGVSKEEASNVLDTFIEDVEDHTSFGIGTDDYVRNVLTGAFGAKKADTIIDRILIGHNAQGLDALKWMSPADVIDIIEGEHPQIMAIVIACLDSDQAGQVVKRLDESHRADVIMRIARLSDVQQGALAEIESLIANKSNNATKSRLEKVGGDKVAADIVNSLESSMSEAIMESIKEKNEELSIQIQEMMFVFDTLLTLDDRGIQSLLREVSNDLLGVALKGCDPAIRDKILGNMSKRAATLLREDMDAMGPTRLSDVEKAQKEILDVARRLADAGEISLGAGDDEFV